MLLNFNKDYLYSHKTLEKSFRQPQYLHIAIASEIEKEETLVSKSDINKLQSVFLEIMETELALKAEIEEEETSYDITASNKSIKSDKSSKQHEPWVARRNIDH